MNENGGGGVKLLLIDQTKLHSEKSFWEGKIGKLYIGGCSHQREFNGNFKVFLMDYR